MSNHVFDENVIVLLFDLENSSGIGGHIILKRKDINYN